jgi:hypothetical protein
MREPCVTSKLVEAFYFTLFSFANPVQNQTYNCCLPIEAIYLDPTFAYRPLTFTH